MPRVLLIDDDEDLRLIAAMALELTGGWQVAEAASGEEGIELAAADPPDVIVVDVVMPGMDGRATLVELQARPDLAQVPVVLLTARTGADEHADLRRLGAARVLTKPFDPATLGDELEDVLEDHS